MRIVGTGLGLDVRLVRELVADETAALGGVVGSSGVVVVVDIVLQIGLTFAMDCLLVLLVVKDVCTNMDVSTCLGPPNNDNS